MIKTCISALFLFITPVVGNTTNFTEVAKEAIPAVVSIHVKTESRIDPFDEMLGDNILRHFFQQPTPRGQIQRRTGFGSGFIVSKDGVILTNTHVVNDANEILVKLNDGREFEGKVIGKDSSTDVAILKIDGKDLPHLQLGNSDALEVGQWVVAIGNPLGLQASLTAGVVSAKGRNNLDIANVEDFIQTDAAINRGNSGGPLMNLKGEVIGMNTALATTMGGQGGYMGIGFAIPSNIAEHVMDELLTTGGVTRGFIGVAMQNITADLAEAFGLKRIEGALVTDVSLGSPAEIAGIRQGDIILEVAGKPIRNMSALRNNILLRKPGSQITLGVMRDGNFKKIPVTLGEYSDTLVSIENGKHPLGIKIEDQKEGTGVLVTKVDPNSAAAWAGIKKGTVILSLNREEISSVQQFHRLLAKRDPNKPILLLVKTGDVTQFISLKIG